MMNYKDAWPFYDLVLKKDVSILDTDLVKFSGHTVNLIFFAAINFHVLPMKCLFAVCLISFNGCIKIFVSICFGEISTL